MTQDDVIEMAREAGFFVKDNDAYSPSVQEDHELTPFLVAFANLVAAKEREACAKVVDDWSDWHGGTKLIAAVIRERGQA